MKASRRPRSTQSLREAARRIGSPPTPMGTAAVNAEARRSINTCSCSSATRMCGAASESSAALAYRCAVLTCSVGRGTSNASSASATPSSSPSRRSSWRLPGLGLLRLTSDVELAETFGRRLSSVPRVDLSLQRKDRCRGLCWGTQHTFAFGAGCERGFRCGTSATSTALDNR